MLFCLPFLNVLLGAGWDKMPQLWKAGRWAAESTQGLQQGREKKKPSQPKSVVGRVDPAGEDQLATVEHGAGLAAHHDCFNNQGLELLSLRLLLCSHDAPPGHPEIWIIFNIVLCCSVLLKN